MADQQYVTQKSLLKSALTVLPLLALIFWLGVTYRTVQANTGYIQELQSKVDKLEAIQTDLYWIKNELAKNDAAHQQIIDLLNDHVMVTAGDAAAARKALRRSP